MNIRLRLVAYIFMLGSLFLPGDLLPRNLLSQVSENSLVKETASSFNKKITRFKKIVKGVSSAVAGIPIAIVFGIVCLEEKRIRKKALKKEKEALKKKNKNDDDINSHQKEHSSS